MRRVALLGLILLSGGCQSLYKDVPGATRPGVGVLVQGVTSRCAPVVVGSTVRRVCLPPPEEKPDSATRDSLAVTR